MGMLFIYFGARTGGVKEPLSHVLLKRKVKVLEKEVVVQATLYVNDSINIT